MKKLSFALLGALLLAACSPQVYPLYLEVRQPSSSGLDLARKSMAIVYMDGVNQQDSLLDRQVASGLARALEADYFDGKEAVSLHRTPSADTVSLSAMHALVMDTDRDVVFLLSSHLGEASEGRIPVATRLFVYDSMGTDKVLRYSGSTTLTGTGAEQAEEISGRIARRFLSTWKKGRYCFYYFENLSETWTDALDYVDEGKLHKAIDVWMPLVKEGSTLKRACAAYNLAMAFYLLGDPVMADKWLAVAEKMENLELAPALRKDLEKSGK